MISNYSLDMLSNIGNARNDLKKLRETLETQINIDFQMLDEYQQFSKGCKMALEGLDGMLSYMALKCGEQKTK